MVVFPTDATPPRADKPHICADGRSVIFVSPFGNRIGFAEDESHTFGVAANVRDYMRRMAA